MKRILIVDDDPQTLRALAINLKARNYAVFTASTGGTGLRLAARRAPDAVILDLALPDLDGVEVIHGLRGWSSAPVIVLSGRSEVTERVTALDAGADDFIPKPFAMEELAARLRAALRRPVPVESPGRVSMGAHIVDLSAHTVLRHTRATPGHGTTEEPDKTAEAVHLTPTEWRLLIVLLRNPERLVTSRELLTEVWGKDRDKRTNYLRFYIHGLRSKLEPDPTQPRYLITEPGVGYRFQP